MKKISNAIAAVFGGFNSCVNISKWRNIEKLFLCVFAIFGMIGGSSGSSTSGGGNEPPQFTSIDNPSVVENSTVVLSLVTTDDGDTTIDYSLGSGTYYFCS